MISIIIPTFNRAELISKAIKSVLDQTYIDWELIVVDDGSTDNTKKVIEEYIKKDPRIKYFHKENGGQGSARNIGIREAGGEYIAFLDSDDEWAPEKLEKQFTTLEKNKDFSFCYTKSLITHPNGRESFFGEDSKNLKHLLLMGASSSSLSSVLVRKDVLLRVGFFDEAAELIGLEDNEHGIRMSQLTGIFLNNPLTIYKMHSGQITQENMGKRIKRQILGLEYILQKNLEMIKRDKKAFMFRRKQIAHLYMLQGDYKKGREIFLSVFRDFPRLENVAIFILSLISPMYMFVYKLRGIFSK